MRMVMIGLEIRAGDLHMFQESGYHCCHLHRGLAFWYWFVLQTDHETSAVVVISRSCLVVG